MNFEVMNVDPEAGEVKVQYGYMSFTCRVLETNGEPFIQKPPYTFIDREAWPAFINLIRTACTDQKVMI